MTNHQANPTSAIAASPTSSEGHLPWSDTPLTTILNFVIGGDWGEAPDFNHEDFVEALCIRGSEFRNWQSEQGSTAVKRKIKSSSLETRKLKEGDILIEISGGGPDQPVGRTVLITNRVLSTTAYKPLVCTNFLRLARTTKHINSVYLNYYLQFFYSTGEVKNYQGGSNNLRNLKFKEYEQIAVPLPPLAEQKVIADKLNDLLAQVDTLKDRLDAIPAILKRFRQSVLAAAVSGKLTKDWHKKMKLSEPELNRLSDLISSLTQGWSPKCENIPARNSEWGVIKTSSIQAGYFLPAENKKLPNLLKARKEITILKGDVLITRAGPRKRCGVTCIVEKDHSNLMICDKVYRIRADDSKILPQYLNWCFNSPQYLKVIEKLKTGSSDSGMNMTQKKLKELNISLPSIQEQHEIVHRVKQFLDYADQIEQQVKNAQSRVNQLTQSILAKAFRGELTEQWRKDNPDLISGENSAEALLERIKAERATQKPKNKNRTRKAKA